MAGGRESGLPKNQREALLKFMKQHPHVLAATDLAASARKKARKIQAELEVAENELHTANTLLVETLPDQAKTEGPIADALEQSTSAEEKVRDAVEELHVVTELLNHPNPEKSQPPTLPSHQTGHVGRSGQGLASVVQHLSAQHPSPRK